MGKDAQLPTVLVVDDEPSLRLVCRVNLELDGYRVLEAPNVAEAEQMLLAESVDVDSDERPGFLVGDVDASHRDAHAVATRDVNERSAVFDWKLGPQD